MEIRAQKEILMAKLDNKLKPRSTKGYYGMLKGVVTRNVLHMPKPQVFEWMFKEDSELYEKIKEEVLNGVNMNKWEVQVWIPAYHGGKTPDPLKIGTEMDTGDYPWAQMCGPIFKDNIGKGEPYPDIWSSMFYGSYLEEVPSTYPAIDDIVWLMFENGDINRPIVVGSLLCDKNKVKYDVARLEKESNMNVVSTAMLETLDIVTINGAQLQYPLAGGTYGVTSKFGWRGAVAKYTDRNFHNGIDFSAGEGTPIVAAHAGVAQAAYDNGGYGNYVTVSGSLGSEPAVTTYYAHMSNFYEIGIGQTKVVEAGDVIGFVGTTGNSTGNHLHFGLKIDGAQFTYVDEVSGKSVTKPHIDPTGYLGI